MNSKDVKEFYDNFLESKMLDYRVRGNLRIERATERILDFVHPGSNVLDVGCGIGITAERIADEVENGHVWAFDISDRNIWYARETVNPPNVTFFVADVSQDRPRIREELTEAVDVVTLVDVIEHIPKDSHTDLFCFLNSIMSERSFIILTYPSPQYQRHLKESNPDELQIIDQVIELEELLESARLSGFSLKHYSLETIWMHNQYVHCVLQSDNSLSGHITSERKIFFQRFMWALKHRWNRYVRFPYLRWKYVDRVFELENQSN